MQGRSRHTIHPLKPGRKTTVAVEHEEFQAMEYDIYVPAGIWSHSAVQAFVNEPVSLEGGATISKGATGLWRGGQEETNIIRIVVRAARVDHDRFFDHLHQRLGELMAHLAEVPEAQQNTMMFTVRPLTVGLCRLVEPK